MVRAAMWISNFSTALSLCFGYFLLYAAVWQQDLLCRSHQVKAYNSSTARGSDQLTRWLSCSCLQPELPAFFSFLFAVVLQYVFPFLPILPFLYRTLSATTVRSGSRFFLWPAHEPRRLFHRAWLATLWGGPNWERYLLKQNVSFFYF